ncbi:hypothetical protein E2C01_009985 [Portunus trituberculatus]|uniref:Uncharacterized protein n=1 Tax=Portunus trituberculatus TaxID=210409 RepID=A0A5B7D761_PORTR|nr:hypothetical protein [Portunus trituberculatus]
MSPLFIASRRKSGLCEAKARTLYITRRLPLLFTESQFAMMSVKGMTVLCHRMRFSYAIIASSDACSISPRTVPSPHHPLGNYSVTPLTPDTTQGYDDMIMVDSLTLNPSGGHKTQEFS